MLIADPEAKEIIDYEQRMIYEDHLNRLRFKRENMQRT